MPKQMENVDGYQASRSSHTLLITGAGGFIGSRLVEQATDVFSHVVAAKRSGGGTSKQNVTEVLADVSLVSDATRLIKDYKPDVVIHLAGLSSALQSRSMIRKTFHANAIGTVNMLDASVEHAVDRFVYCGSMEEPVAPNSAIPTSPYAASKYVGSVYARMCSSVFDLDTVIVKPFFVYGPGNQKPEKLVPYVIRCFLSGTPPQLSSANRLMDWVYIDDVVQAFLRASLVDTPKGCEVPVGTGILSSIRDVVSEISDICRPSVKAIYGDEPVRKREVSPAATVAECERLLGWSPQTLLKDGLRETVSWYQKRLAKSERSRRAL